MNYKIIDFNTSKEKNEVYINKINNNKVPFEIKRIYYIYDTQSDINRGQHAHKQIDQLAICLEGSCKFILDDGKKDKKIITLNSPDKGLLIGNMVWGEMFDFSQGSILMVLASDYYDESEYIRNYDEFLELIKKMSK